MRAVNRVSHVRLDETEKKQFPLGFYVNRKMAEFEDLVKVDAYVRRSLLFNSPQGSEVRPPSSIRCTGVKTRSSI